MSRTAVSTFALSLLLLATLAEEIRAQTPFWKPTTTPFGGSVYTLLADYDDRLYALAGGRLYHSSDRGENWMPSSTDPFFRFRGLVAGSGGLLIAIDSTVAYRSTDGGDHWVQLPPIPDFDSTTRYDYIARDSSSSDLYMATTPGIFRSTDNGDRSSQITTTANRSGPLQAANGSLYRWLGGIDRYDRETGFARVELHLPSPSVTTSIANFMVTARGHLFIRLYNSSSGFHYYRSTDRGENWTSFSSPMNDLYYTMAAGRLGDIYLVGAITYRSTDNGEHWSPFTLLPGSQNNIAFAATGDGAIYRGVNDGVFRTMDTGEIWTQHQQGLAARSFSSLAEASPGILFATSDTLLYRSTDNGTTWEAQENPIDGSSTHIAATDLRFTVFSGKNGLVFVAGTTGYPQRHPVLYCSDDYGLTWVDLTGTLPPTTRIYALAAGSNGDLYLAHDSGTVSASTDGGMSWQTRTTNKQTFFTALAIDSIGRVFAGGSQLYRSIDRGASWRQVELPPSGYLVYAMAADGDHRLYLNSGVRFSLSTDGGELWKEMTPMERFPRDASAIAIGARHEIYTMSLNGVWRSTDQGANWSPLNSGLYMPAPRAIVVTSSGRVVLATEYGGIYLGEDAITGVDSEPSLMPANSEIEFSLAPSEPPTLTRMREE